MMFLSQAGATFARKMAPSRPSGAPMATERSVVTSEPTMNESAPNLPSDGSQLALKKNSSGLTAANVMRPWRPTKKMMEKMMMVMRKAAAMKRYRPHLS